MMLTRDDIIPDIWDWYHLEKRESKSFTTWFSWVKHYVDHISSEVEGDKTFVYKKKGFTWMFYASSL